MKCTKPIPIGIEFYKQIIENDYYYVDKTLLIRDILRSGSAVTLFTRPRRFGKTLVQSMIKTFFEIEIDSNGNVVNNYIYFKGKKIIEVGKEWKQHIGKYPVIFLSLKSAKQSTYKMAYESMIDEIRKEYERHKYVLKDVNMTDGSREIYTSVLNMKARDTDYTKGIVFLSKCLEEYHKQKVIILIDEYDVPLENAYFRGFYNEMIDFIRPLFESALKTNESLKFAVVTGCLRISKESIFTGLNNLKVESILDAKYAEYFGFTQNEVDSILETYDITEKRNEIKDWYNGYLFGKTEVYNPWSIVNYVYDIINGNTEFPKPYWSNTSSNNVIHELIDMADLNTRQEVEDVIGGNTIEKPIHEEITYEDIYKSQDNLWNFLFFTGYVKAVNKSFDGSQIYVTMKIPNKEILYIYRNTVTEWFKNRIEAMDFSELYRSIIEGNIGVIESILRKNLRESISFLDSAENFYHGFMLGLLGGLQGYRKLSNRESGNGRYDIVLKPYDERESAIILELKCVRKFTEMEDMCQKALQQIEDKHYDKELIDDGYVLIKKYGICFCKKSCKVMVKAKKTRPVL